MANEPMERSWANVSGYGPAAMPRLSTRTLDEK